MKSENRPMSRMLSGGISILTKSTDGRANPACTHRSEYSSGVRNRRATAWSECLTSIPRSRSTCTARTTQRRQKAPVPSTYAPLKKVVLNAKTPSLFNTTFFNGAYVDGTGAFWRRWVVRAVQVLRERGIEVKHSDHAVARQFLTPEEYSDLCVQAGFARPSVDLVRIEMPPESMRDIGRFSLFIEGALPGVPLEEGSAALEKGLERAMDETGVCGVPRNWLECLARAP